jgi:hypothetical protein
VVQGSPYRFVVADGHDQSECWIQRTGVRGRRGTTDSKTCVYGVAASRRTFLDPRILLLPSISRRRAQTTLCDDFSGSIGPRPSHLVIARQAGSNFCLRALFEVINESGQLLPKICSSCK